MACGGDLCHLACAYRRQIDRGTPCRDSRPGFAPAGDTRHHFAGYAAASVGFRHNEQFVVPQQLPPTQPSFTWQPTDPVVLQYRFPVLPHSVVAGVIVKLRQFIVDEVIWRDGALLAVGGCQALLLGDSAKTR